jgi:type VI protein secretion system component VasF
MGKQDEKDWEALLRRGLDQVADLGGEEPPDLAALQMLVADVQAEQRRRLYRDLLAFWAVAAVLLAGLALALVREPAGFLAFQGVVAVLSLIGAGVWYTGWRRVTE